MKVKHIIVYYIVCITKYNFTMSTIYIYNCIRVNKFNAAEDLLSAYSLVTIEKGARYLKKFF